MTRIGNQLCDEIKEKYNINNNININLVDESLLEYNRFSFMSNTETFELFTVQRNDKCNLVYSKARSILSKDKIKLYIFKQEVYIYEHETVGD